MPVWHRWPPAEYSDIHHGPPMAGRAPVCGGGWWHDGPAAGAPTRDLRSTPPR